MNKNEFEVRASTMTAEGESRKLVGYAVRWNKPSEVLWGEFVEMFDKGAFAQSLASGADVRALFEHDHSKLLGRTTSGTLSLMEDEQGLRFSLDLPKTQLGDDILESVKRGDLSGMSFGFRALADEWDETGKIAKRTVKQAELMEITVTSIPAYPDSSLAIAKRSMKKGSNSRQKMQMWCDVLGA